MPVVLVLTQEPSIDQLCWQALSRVGHEVISVKTVAEAIHASLAVKVSAAIIDATAGAEDIEAVSAWLTGNLKEEAGLVFIISPRTRPATLPIDPERDQIVVEPCSAEAVREAVERAMSGAGQPPPEKQIFGSIELSRPDQTVRNQAGTVTLTHREFQIIEYLAAHRGRFVPAAELAEKIWRRPRGGEYSSIVSTSMKNLRDKLQPLTNGKALIETFPRRGYLLHN